ncbi:hypothetical protein [Leifsonia sp. P73]|uniref:hypothetical protein n=1 Tax=Leifsonia sp. P73 TaxID=3423959 RepID=UPI003DA404AD
MASYTVTAERAGDWWVLQAVEAPGAISQVASLDQADQIIEAIAFVTGEPADDIEIRVQRVFDVTVAQEGLWWMVAIPELDGLTQAADLGDVPLMAREYIAATLDLPRDGIEVRVTRV